MYNNIICSSSGVLSPPSLYGDSCARRSTPSRPGRTSSGEGYALESEEFTLEGRFTSLEARQNLHESEIGILKGSVEDMSGWRASMDAASEQTLETLRCLDHDIGELKERIILSQVEPIDGEESLKDKVESCAIELAHLKTLESVQGQLDNVDSRLKEAERILVNSSAFETVLSEIKNDIADVEVMAGSAVDGVSRVGGDVQHVVDMVETLQDNVHEVDSKVETIRLALDVVEQSLEDFDESETIESLRSRMDDLDVGIEKVARDSERRMKELSERVDALKEELHNSMVPRKADEAFEIAQRTSLEVSDLKREMRHANLGSVSGASSPATVSSRSSDARVKAAVHTLSDGYRSLHKAMGLMYDEHAELSKRITRAGHDAHKVPQVPTLREKVQSLDCKVSSFPIVIQESDAFDDLYSEDNGTQGLKVLLAAQLKDTQRAEKRIESLEDEVRQLRQILQDFVVSTKTLPKDDTLKPQVRMHTAWSPSRNAYSVTLTCS